MTLTAVVLAAGQGTRMRSKTPKVLHDLCGWPLVRWPVEAALGAGAGKVVVVGGPDRAVEGHLPDGVVIAEQPEAKGTGHAMQCAAGHVDADATVVVLYGDVPLITAEAIAALAAAHAGSRAAATIVTTALDDPAGYGRVVRDAAGDVVRVVETKDPRDATPEELAIAEVNTGIYAFDGGRLLAALERLTPDNAQGEYYLTDVVAILREAGERVAAHVVADPSLTLGINDRTQLAEVRALAQRRILDAHGRAGVTFVNPAATTVDVGVAIGADTTVEPGCVIRGASTIGEGCRIGPNTTIVGATIGDGVAARHAWLEDAEVEDDVSIGPFAYLRPGTRVRRGAKIGTFVELKNSDIGEGTKVPHLSYLGDADVGPNTNIGASNVTANYDGRAKHRTTIGANVRTSVDTTFVAPVTVGDGAYTGAGSVITEDVPEDALGIARARQTNVEGYARRKG
ncbi:MAG TPA: bifunctional UDP-N-acetylglucosamine diphosphorylase/glucosamine-1-phosphate N-acetyltransferase GlmU [Solirubrobacteraceae bacterium]|nr:bifunctional UDP-N-acetylglucosamine diphosphorylase/glucosamine-1-phosphate N-acetyltransferase GlmU [Solirubrobacteraceae bacterium]